MEQRLIRQHHSGSGTSEYVLTSTEYDRLIADGHDPATVAGEELARYASTMRDYDEQGRWIMEMIKDRSNVVVFEYPELNSEFDPETDPEDDA